MATWMSDMLLSPYWVAVEELDLSCYIGKHGKPDYLQYKSNPASTDTAFLEGPFWASMETVA